MNEWLEGTLKQKSLFVHFPDVHNKRLRICCLKGSRHICFSAILQVKMIDGIQLLVKACVLINPRRWPWIPSQKTHPM